MLCARKGGRGASLASATASQPGGDLVTAIDEPRDSCDADRRVRASVLDSFQGATLRTTVWRGRVLGRSDPGVTRTIADHWRGGACDRLPGNIRMLAVSA